MNPNICTVCEKMFTQVMRARNIPVDVTILFADLRQFTVLSQAVSSERLAALLDLFYDECAAAIWEYDGLLNKTIGDAVMAIFNFPIRRPDHAARAVAAAREIRRRCHDRQHGLSDTVSAHGGDEVAVGIGIDSGIVNFGEFGHSHRDLTAIGTIVNTAARAESVAAAGQILVTRSVRERAALEGAEGRVYPLKGLSEPVELFAA